MFNLIKTSAQKLKKALNKTRSLLGDQIRSLFKNPLNDETFIALEEILYESDLGPELAEEFTNLARHLPKEEILEGFATHAEKILQTPTDIGPKEPKEGEPKVILVVGVNGSGKTTTVAKLAKRYRDEGKKVLVAAGDTFRAAAVEQLEIWAKRLKIDIVKGRAGGDSAAVLYDAIAKAKSGYDVLIADTAGRLQAKTELMHELGKVEQVCKKQLDSAPHEALLVLDATTGQNALDQAITFNQFTPLTGIALTKIDGSAKGGIVLSIYRKLGVPICYLGVGEKAEDLLPFDEKIFAEALFQK
ncbi:MAG: signal recognition particle-docking protein FtsY [Candidatus Algichlamydia australiensis]|nr:signal recognition particle-docking protein FtsY [Chlamydiales bacterium]